MGKKTLRLVTLAILLALVIVLQMVGSYLHIGPVSISLVLIPIVVGAVLLGPWAGALLGFAFGLVTVIAGLTGADGFTQILLQAQPVLTVAICLVKATAAGLCAGLVFRPLGKKHPYFGVFSAAATAPIVNTGIFIAGGFLLASTLRQFIPEGRNLVWFLVIACAGVNFLVEFGLNLLLAPAIYRVIRAVNKG